MADSKIHIRLTVPDDSNAKFGVRHAKIEDGYFHDRENDIDEEMEASAVNKKDFKKNDAASVNAISGAVTVGVRTPGVSGTKGGFDIARSGDVVVTVRWDIGFALDSTQFGPVTRSKPTISITNKQSTKYTMSVSDGLKVGKDLGSPLDDGAKYWHAAYSGTISVKPK